MLIYAEAILMSTHNIGLYEDLTKISLITFQTSPDKSGAFCQWNVILCCDKNKEGSYKRLLEAGGATVTSQR